MSLTEEIHFHWKALVGADETKSFKGVGLTETEYHMANRILIDTGHGRMTIRIDLGQGEEE